VDITRHCVPITSPSLGILDTLLSSYQVIVCFPQEAFPSSSNNSSASRTNAQTLIQQHVSFCIAAHAKQSERSTARTTDNPHTMSGSELQLYGFGSNYYYAFGGSELVALKDHDQSIPAYTFPSHPWNNKNNDSLQDIQCTTSSTLFLTCSGKIFHVGTMHGVLNSIPRQVTIPYPLPVANMACGRHYCLVLLQGGAAVLSWGAGHFGQLGLGPHVSVTSEPTLVPHLLPKATGASPVVALTAGAWHAAAITKEGKAFSWGSNRKGQCGIATPATIVYPHPVDTQESFAMIACGKAHSVGLTVEGKVYSWGAAAVCGHSSRKSTNISSPRLMEALSKVHVIQVATGESHSLALTGGGRVFGWGNNTEGQLGLGLPSHVVSKPKLIAELDFVAIVASEEWAKSQATSDLDDASPQLAPCFDEMASLADEVVPFPQMETASQILPRVPKIQSIAASGSYSVAISTSGHVYGWGCNDTGVLGMTPTSSKLPMLELPSSSSPPCKGRLLEIQTFDSQHNVLLPRRLDALAQIQVSTVAAGPSHLYVCGTPRTTTTKDMVGRTLYEMQHLPQDVYLSDDDAVTTHSTMKRTATATPSTPRRASAPFSTTDVPSSRRSRRSLSLGKLIRRMGGRTEVPRAPTSRVRKFLSSAFGGKS